MRSYYEFFAGGGMARTGLGQGWTCLFANDIDAKKGTSYAVNWGNEHLKIEDVGALSSKDLTALDPQAERRFIANVEQVLRQWEGSR